MCTQQKNHKHFADSSAIQISVSFLADFNSVVHLVFTCKIVQSRCLWAYLIRMLLLLLLLLVLPSADAVMQSSSFVFFGAEIRKTLRSHQPLWPWWSTGCFFFLPDFWNDGKTWTLEFYHQNSQSPHACVEPHRNGYVWLRDKKCKKPLASVNQSCANNSCLVLYAATCWTRAWIGCLDKCARKNVFRSGAKFLKPAQQSGLVQKNKRTKRLRIDRKCGVALFLLKLIPPTEWELVFGRGFVPERSNLQEPKIWTGGIGFSNWPQFVAYFAEENLWIEKKLFSVQKC